MEEIYSWSEFTQAFPRETGFDADKLSRDIVGAFIKVCYNNYDMNIQFSEGNNCSDLYWESPVSGTLSSSLYKYTTFFREKQISLTFRNSL